MKAMNAFRNFVYPLLEITAKPFVIITGVKHYFIKILYFSCLSSLHNLISAQVLKSRFSAPTYISACSFAMMSHLSHPFYLHAPPGMSSCKHTMNAEFLTCFSISFLSHCAGLHPSRSIEFFICDVHIFVLPVVPCMYLVRLPDFNTSSKMFRIISNTSFWALL
jgi:hypothetical protein